MAARTSSTIKSTTLLVDSRRRAQHSSHLPSPPPSSRRFRSHPCGTAIHRPPSRATRSPTTATRATARYRFCKRPSAASTRHMLSWNLTSGSITSPTPPFAPGFLRARPASTSANLTSPLSWAPPHHRALTWRIPTRPSLRAARGRPRQSSSRSLARMAGCSTSPIPRRPRHSPPTSRTLSPTRCRRSSQMARVPPPLRSADLRPPRPARPTATAALGLSATPRNSRPPCSWQRRTKPVSRCHSLAPAASAP